MIIIKVRKLDVSPYPHVRILLTETLSSGGGEVRSLVSLDTTAEIAQSSGVERNRSIGTVELYNRLEVLEADRGGDDGGQELNGRPVSATRPQCHAYTE